MSETLNYEQTKRRIATTMISTRQIRSSKFNVFGLEKVTDERVMRRDVTERDDQGFLGSGGLFSEAKFKEVIASFVGGIDRPRMPVKLCLVLQVRGARTQCVKRDKRIKIQKR